MFYHCSHAPFFPPGFQFHLTKQVQVPPLVHSDYTVDDLGEKFKNLYPAGLSNHGVNHLGYFTTQLPDGTVNISTKPLMEHLFELVRSKDFPNLPSRFLSFFACLTLDDALELKAKTFNTERFIYRVTSDQHFIADMNWVHLGNSIPETFVLAENYWSGRHSSKPQLEALLKAPMTLLGRAD